MPTKVLDIELAGDWADPESLDGYEQALVLFRFHGLPVGKAWVPVKNGSIALRQAIVSMADWPLWDALLNEYLEIQLAPPPSPEPATVAICTRDRPQDVERCLQGLMKLQGRQGASEADSAAEILVVDNCPSNDDTQKVAASFGSRIRYVREEIPGLNRARNRAIQEARHAIIAFTDDDTVTDPQWLAALTRNFTDPQVLCVTGLTMPLELETKAQEWFERHNSFCRGFFRREFDQSQFHPVAASRVGAGANMAVRREILQRVGPFDENLDAGTPTRSGGDTEMFARILAQGYRIVYDPAAVSWHRHRSTWDELTRAIYGYGTGTYAIFTKKLLFEGELYVPALAAQWFWFEQFPKMARSLLRLPGSVPLALIFAELSGCLAGPRAYLSTRKRTRNETRNDILAPDHH